MKKFFSVIVGLCLGFGAGFLLRGPFCGYPRQVSVRQIDTLVLRDTVTVKMPVVVETRRVDTMYIAIRDTAIIRDTSYVLVEREQLHYSEDRYEAWVSGYRPALDSIRIYTDSHYITMLQDPPPSRKRWCVGLQAGYGLAFTSPAPQFSPYIGIGITYDFGW